MIISYVLDVPESSIGMIHRILNSHVRMATLTGLVFLVVGCGNREGGNVMTFEPGIGWTNYAASNQDSTYQPLQQLPQYLANRESEGTIDHTNTQPSTPSQSTIKGIRENTESEYYTIQLSVWRTESKAYSQALIYRKQGLEAYVNIVVLPGTGTWYRVRVGKYVTFTDAKQAAQLIENTYNCHVWIDTIIRG